MPEIVILIADLYLAHDAPLAEAAPRGALPGIESAARFGERASLAHGWRAWLAASLGRADLAAAAPASIAAVTADMGRCASPAPAAAVSAAGTRTRWIATPLELRATQARTHLEHRGILRLPLEQLAELAESFRESFASSGFALAPLPSGDFLLETPGIAAVPTTEPARWAGGDVAEGLPRGPAAAPLRRFLSELEMWLHGQELNEARRRRGEPPVTTLWPWGAAGQPLLPERREAPARPAAFGSDAYLGGLWQLLGGACRALPERLEDIAATSSSSGAVLVVEIAGELRRRAEGTLADAMAGLDARFVSPALEALRRGEVNGVTLIANDMRVTVNRRSHLRLWRRGRAGLESFA